MTEFETLARQALETGRKMRAEQKGFFAALHGSPEKRKHLDESRRLERLFDRELAAVLCAGEGLRL